MLFDFDMIQKVYSHTVTRVDAARKLLNRPLTLTEKIIYTHLIPGAETKTYTRGKDFADFNPDRVAMQDATAQMALLQFTTAGRAKVAVPSSVHADHLITAKVDAKTDLPFAKQENAEVYDFLSSVCSKYGIDFWKPGAGIIHQVALENYAFPGGLMIGTDSHTVNAGGLGMLAIGVGGADAVDAMVGLPWELKYPKIIGVKLTGKLNGFASPKDIILKLAGILTVKGGTNCIVEYFGEGARSLSCTGKGTICNMGAEIGATTSTFSYDDSMARYLRATGRAEVAAAADKVAKYLQCDPEVEAATEKNPMYFDSVIEIDLNTLKPHYNGPFSPDRAFEVGNMAESVKEFDSITTVSAALIGSCTNSSFEDLSRAASICQQALDKGIAPKCKLIINPGSEVVRATAEAHGLMDVFNKFGAVLMTNACGPCIGMWDRDGASKAEKNTIVHSFNRNFKSRADGNPNTHAFVSSPEMAAVAAISGSLLFDPTTDTLTNAKGEQVKLVLPTGDELPKKGFHADDPGFQAPAKDGSAITIAIDPKSDRLQKLEPFTIWNGQDIKGAALLIKAKGKCTTDHISMAGPWLKYRGHLENISNNLLIGATNFVNGEANKVKNEISGEYVKVPEAAKAYKAAGIGSIVFGDENYGEGSSREHAAMEPRFLGVHAVMVKSFARIHETNLKKQGMLALTFANAADYDKVQEGDKIDILGLASFAPGKNLSVVLHHKDGSSETIEAKHTYNDQQIVWFKAGSALNEIKKNFAAAAKTATHKSGCCSH